MTKFIQALLSGMLFSFILDYFFFLTIKNNYIDPLGIHVYYNVLFADNQNIFIYLLCSIFLGFLIMYVKTKIKYIFLFFLFVLALLIQIPSIGKLLGEKLFMQKNVTLHNKKFTFVGDIYYIGRDKITFYDKELQKVILLDKNEILEKDMIE